MAKLQFLDLDDITLKSIANINSPSFTGNPLTVNPIDDNGEQIINYKYLKKVVDKAINSFNIESAESNTNVLSQLVPGADYQVYLYGINTINCDPSFPYDVVYTSKYPEDYVFIGTTQKVFIDDGEEPLPKGYVKIGYFAILDKAGNVLARSDETFKAIDWPNDDGSFPQSVNMRITAPIDGYIYGYLNYGMYFAMPIPVKYMSALRVNDTEIETYKASIVQQDRQTIIVTVNDIDYKDNFTAEPGTAFTARSEGIPGYKGGTVTPSSGTFDSNIIFTVSAATPTTYTCTIIQKPHQTIKVKYGTSDYTSTIRGIQVNSVLLARVTSVDYGYTAGIISPSSNIRVINDITVTASDVTPIPYTITITQMDHELIEVIYDDHVYYNTFAANYTSTIKVSIVSLDTAYYKPGNIIISGNYESTSTENVYRVKGAITITASAAQEITSEGGE